MSFWNWRRPETGYTRESLDKVQKTGWLGNADSGRVRRRRRLLDACRGLARELGEDRFPGPIFSSSILASLIILQAGAGSRKSRCCRAFLKGKDIFCVPLQKRITSGPRTRFKRRLPLQAGI